MKPTETNTSTTSSDSDKDTLTKHVKMLWTESAVVILFLSCYACGLFVCGVSWKWRDTMPERVRTAIQTIKDKHTLVLIPSKRKYNASELLEGDEVYMMDGYKQDEYSSASGKDYADIEENK